MSGGLDSALEQSASVPDSFLQTLGRPQREDSVVVGVCVCVCVCACSHSVMSDSCDRMDCPRGSSVHGILQARTLEWVAIPPPGDLPDPGL